MATTTSDTISILNDLIETCKDGQEGFRTAAEGATQPSLRTLFNELSLQRARFAGELQSEVVRLGGDPEKSGSFSAALHRGWIDIRKIVTGSDDHAILAECERGEDVALKNYSEAMDKELPGDLRPTVQRQFEQIRKAHDTIRTLRDGGVTPDVESTLPTTNMAPV